MVDNNDSNKTGCITIAIGSFVILSIIAFVLNATTNFLGSLSPVVLLILGVLSIIVMIKIVD